MKRGLAAAAVWLGIAVAAAQAQTPQPEAPAYRKAGDLSGRLASVGSSTMKVLMQRWSAAFAELYPDVRVAVEAETSSKAPVALTSGIAQLAPMSRRMHTEEIAAFEAKFRYQPLELVVGHDAIVVWAQRDNPLPGLTLAQLDALFSTTRRRGAPAAIETWGQLGLGGEWAGQKVALFGRNEGSTTRGYFAEHVLRGGAFRKDVRDQPGSAAVVFGVSERRNALGYASLGWRTSRVRAAPLAAEAGKPFVEPTPEAIAKGQYPLSRDLYLYVNRAPGKPLDPLLKEFLRFAFSREGQKVAVDAGLLSLSPEAQAAERAKLE